MQQVYDFPVALGFGNVQGGFAVASFHVFLRSLLQEEFDDWSVPFLCGYMEWCRAVFLVFYVYFSFAFEQGLDDFGVPFSRRDKECGLVAIVFFVRLSAVGEQNFSDRGVPCVRRGMEWCAALYILFVWISVVDTLRGKRD